MVTCSLKILAVADFHGSSQAFSSVAVKAAESKMDLVVMCGDLTHFGSLDDAKRNLSIVSKAKLPVFFIPGNCDPPQLANESTDSAKCLHGDCRRFHDIAFFGVGGSPPTPFHSPFELSEEEIGLLLQRGFANCSRDEESSRVVLVSHSPPRGTRLDMTSSGEHVGSTSVRNFVEEARPALVVCGHIHEASGLDRIGTTLIVNPGPARHNQCAVIDFGDDIEVSLSPLNITGQTH